SLEGSVPWLGGGGARMGVEPCSELRPYAQRMRLSRQCRIEERTVDDVLGSRRIEGHEQLGGPARSSSTGIVAGIGIDDRCALATLGIVHSIGDGHERLAKAATHRPGALGNFIGQLLR